MIHVSRKNGSSLFVNSTEKSLSQPF